MFERTRSSEASQLVVKDEEELRRSGFMTKEWEGKEHYRQRT